MTVLIPHSLQGSQSRIFWFETKNFQVAKDELNRFSENFSFITSVRIPGFSRYLYMDILGPVEGNPSLIEVACVTTTHPSDDGVLTEDAKYFLAYSIAKSLHSFQLSVFLITFSDSWTLRISNDTNPEFLISDWGDDLLLNRTSSQTIDPVRWITQHTSLAESGDAEDFSDLMTYICMRRREALERIPMDTKLLPNLLVEWGSNGEALRDAREAYLWTRNLFPSYSTKFFTSEKLSAMINGPSLPRDHPWSVHRRLAVAMKRGTMTEVVSIIQGGKLPDPDRLKVYAFLLGCDSGSSTAPEEAKSLPRRPLHTRFKSLIAHQQCGWEIVLEKFFQRIVLHSKEDSLNLLREYLNVMDPPLLDVIDRAPFDMNVIIGDIFACTSLCDQELLSLWDVLMVSPPDTLIKVLVFVLIELRELVMQEVDNLGNVLLCVGDLVNNFPELVNIALSETILD